MATPRIPFLWPMLAKGFEVVNPSIRSAATTARIRSFHSSSTRKKPEAAPQQQRYGTANQPPLRPNANKWPEQPTGQDGQDPEKALPKISDRLQHAGEAKIAAERGDARNDAPNKEATTVDGPLALASNIQSDPMLDSSDGRPADKPPSAPEIPPEKPLQSLLNMVPNPTEHSEEVQAAGKSGPEEHHPDLTYDEHAPPVKAPHIDAPRYVHHFDTYGLVRRLVESGWSEKQAITSMKAVRLMLSSNMELAREALVSKSQVENETYLFRAACAELKTEVTSRRRTEQEKMRTERTQLQHEVEILSQKIGQESGVLKDDLKGMFDDRKMAVRNEQRAMESKVQRLNYQITVDLQADAKSEVEGLRWVMTRRVIIALAAVVIMVLGSLKLFSAAAHEQEMNAKRLANMRSGSTQTESRSGGNGQQRDQGSDGMHGGSEMLVDSLPTG